MQRRAIVIFARIPRDEAQAKGLPHLERLFRDVIAAWVRAASRCGATAIVASDQRGDSFGERLANAVSDAFGAGFTTLLITGLDTPPPSLEDAFAAVGNRQRLGGSVFLLPASTDIDSAGAFRAARRELLWRPYLADETRPERRSEAAPDSVMRIAGPLRAPPRAA